MTDEERSIEAAIASAFALRDFCNARDCDGCPFHRGVPGCSIWFPVYDWDLTAFENEVQ